MEYLLTEAQRNDVYDNIPVEDGGTVKAERIAFCKAQLHHAAVLLNGKCPHLPERFDEKDAEDFKTEFGFRPWQSRKDCPICWKEFLQSAGEREA